MLAARNLGLAVPGRTLVQGLDLAIGAGECWAILGPNGAGKTSVLLALAGLRAPESGEVTLDGAPICARPRREVARRVGLLLQDEPEEFWGTVLDYVLLGRLPYEPALFGPDPAGANAAQVALARMDLAGRAAQPFRTLSGGERQRARLAQLAVQDPAVWLLDEPLSHLDLRHQLEVMRQLAQLAAGGRAVAVTLHDPLWAARHCDRALLLYDSARFVHGAAADVLTRSNLEALYGCPLESVRAAGRDLLLPADR